MIKLRQSRHFAGFEQRRKSLCGEVALLAYTPQKQCVLDFVGATQSPVRNHRNYQNEDAQQS